MFKKKLKRLFIIFVLSIFVFSGVEIFLRLFFYLGYRLGLVDFFTFSYVSTEMKSFGCGHDKLISHDSELIYKYLPNKRILLKTDEYEHLIETSDVGFGDIGFRDNGVSGKIFAVAVGDSITACIGVEYEHCWVKILEDKIKADIINMGVGGYSSIQKKILAFKYASKMSPKVLFFEINFSDPCDDFFFANRKVFPVPHPLNSFIDQDIKDYFVSLVLLNFLVDYRTYNLDKRYREYYSKCNFGITLTIKSIEQVYEYFSKSEAKFILLVFHSNFFPKELRNYVFKDLKNRAHVIDLESDGLNMYYPKDGHLNQNGNEFVAEKIYRYLIENHVIDFDD